MSQMVCRLCLNGDNVVDMFHADLTNSERLRTCVLLATGVNISRDDVTTKHVCSTCCNISVKLYKFRLNALANDRALKVAYRQSCNKSPLKVEEMISMNTSVMEKLLVNVTEPPKARNSYAVHPSIVRLFKTHQNLQIPNELLCVNLDARLCLKPLTVKDFPKDVDEQDPLDVPNATHPDVNLVKVHESRKRSCEEETKDVQEKRLKLDDSIVEASKCDVNIEPRSKPIGIVSYKVVESEPGNDMANGTNKIVLARVITNECNDNITDNYRPPTDNSSSSEDFSDSMAKLSRKSRRSHKSRPSASRTDYESNGDCALPETIDEEKIYNCDLCYKCFNRKIKVRRHMLKMHENCLVCKTVFRSSDALSHHQKNVCFKQLILHQPTLCLKRCDEKTEIHTNKLQNPSAEDDEILLISDDEESPIEGLEASEATFIQSLFNKYKNLRNRIPQTKPPTQHKIVQTTCTNAILDKPFNIRRLDEDRILVEAMFSSLSSQRIPLKQQVEPEVSARFEHKESQTGTKKVVIWSGNANQLSNKVSVNNQTVNFKKPIPYHTQPSTTRTASPAPQTSYVLQEQSCAKAVQQTTAPTTSFLTSTDEIVAQKNAVNVVQQLPCVQQNVAQNNALNVAEKNVPVVRTQLPVGVTTPSHLAPTGVIEPNIVQKNAQNRDPQWSANDKPRNATNGYLRVKAQWELM